jgi:hypoxanthine phosphoribosyltransferase
MTVERRVAGGEPVLVAGPPYTIEGRRVLIVDETCDTGSTMVLALKEVRAARPAAVQTAVSFRTGAYLPDFHGFETPSFIILPWDREIIVNGELVIRPDYAARLEEAD